MGQRIALLSGLLLACNASKPPAADIGPDLGPPPQIHISSPDWLPLGGRVAFRIAAWRNGKPAPGEPVTVSMVGAALLYSGATGPNGTAEASFRVPNAPSDDATVTVNVGEASSAVRVRRSLPAKAAYRPMIELDRDRVRTGESVRIRATILDADQLNVAAGVPTELRVLAPDGTVVSRQTGSSDLTGRMTMTLPIDPGAPPGAWRVEIVGGRGASRLLTVLRPAGASTQALPQAKAKADEAGQALMVRALAEGGALVPGIENRLIVIVTRANGSPAVADITLPGLPGGELTGRSDASGIARIKLVPPAGEGPFKATLRVLDKAGRVGEQEVLVARAPAGQGLSVRPAFALAPPGKRIRAQVLGEGAGTVWIDVVRDGRAVAVRSVEMVGGKAMVDLDPADLGSGLVWIMAHTTGGATAGAYGAAPVFVPPGKALEVAVTPSKLAYNAGEKIELALEARSEIGQAVAATLMGVVREAGSDGSLGGEAARRAIAAVLLGPEAAGVTHADGSDLASLAAGALGGLVPVEGQWIARALMAALPRPAPSPAWEDSTMTLPAPPAPPAQPPTEEAKAAPKVSSASAAGAVLAFPDTISIQAKGTGRVDVQTTDTTDDLDASFVAFGGGRFGVGSARITVHRPFDMTVPIPRFLTVGDVLTVPIVARNLTKERLDIRVLLEMAPWHEIRDVQQIGLLPDEGQRVTGGFRLAVIRPGEQELTLVARAGLHKQTVKVPISVRPRGRHTGISRSGVLGEREQVVKFAVPKSTAAAPLEAVLTLDGGYGAIAARAVAALRARPRRDLRSVVATVRATARLVLRPGALATDRRDVTTDLLADLQRLLSFERAGAGVAWYPGGQPDARAAAEAAHARSFIDAVLKRESRAPADMVPPPPSPPAEAASEETGSAEQPRKKKKRKKAKQGSKAKGAKGARGNGEVRAGDEPMTVERLLDTRDPDGAWGSAEATDRAIATLLAAAEDAGVVASEVMLELDGKPLPKVDIRPVMVGSTGGARTVQLGPRLKAGAHKLRILTPEPGTRIPWAVTVRTYVAWRQPKRKQAGLTLKVAIGGGSVGKRIEAKVTVKRRGAPTGGPSVVRVALPPGFEPRMIDLDDELYRGHVGGFSASPGAVHLFLDESEDAKWATTFGLVPTTAGAFRRGPSKAWSVLRPELVTSAPGAVVKVR